MDPCVGYVGPMGRIPVGESGEGKEGRPPRFDPVLDEVAAKLEKEVLA